MKDAMRTLSVIPLLETGDHLSREEFDRRFDAMPGLKKAERIEGIVYVSGRVRVTTHGGPHAELTGWLGVYRAFTPGIQVGNGCTVRLDRANDPQPDALMMLRSEHGGQASIDAEGYVRGAPELVAEVAATSASLELHTKRRIYWRNGVCEYIVWRVLDEAIDWFVLRHGQYEQLERTAAGFLQSEQFPGLWLDPDALLRFDLARVLQVVQQGTASPEHAAFVAQLQQKATGRP